MEYSRILKRAITITWHHKALWLFGFLLALFGGAGGGGSGRGVQWNIGQDELARPEWVIGIVVVILAAVVLLVIAAVVLNNISRGALVHMVSEVENTGSTTVRSGWHAGTARLLSLIGIDLVSGIPAAIASVTLIVLAASPLLLLLIAQPGSGSRQASVTAIAVLLTVLFELAVIAILVVAGVALGIVRELAYRRCVLGGAGSITSLRGGYRTFRANLGRVGGLWLLLFGIDLAAGVVAFPLYLVVYGLAGGFGALVYSATEAAAPAIVTGLLLAVPGILLISAVSGVYLVFRSTSWTLGYRELSVPLPDSE